MKIKPFLQIVYASAGFFISLFTAVMTYLIIDEPIGYIMLSKITIVVLVTFPLIWVFSYFIGVYLSKKFESISQRLDAIDANKFLHDTFDENIEDIANIHNSINHLSFRLEKSISDLQKNNEDLQTIVKSLAHDIKTPLTIINGYLEEIEDKLIKEEDIPYTIDVLKKETAYLNELSSDVISYLQSKESLVESQEIIYLKDFMHIEVCPLLRVAKSVTLKCDISDDDTLKFNRVALKKIFINLLHNASKYTLEGTITTTLHNDEIAIEDTGCGIKSEDAERIFEPFVCLDASKNREKSGFGLGLSIGANLAQNNGYKLSLDTSYTKGSKFVLRKIG